MLVTVLDCLPCLFFKAVSNDLHHNFMFGLINGYGKDAFEPVLTND